MTAFLINPAHRKRKKRASGSRTKKRATKRRPPKGFKSWKTYMASIRPGGTKKKRTKRRKSAAKKTTRRRRRTTAAGAAPARSKKVARRRRKSPSRARKTSRRRRYSRNPGMGSVVGVIRSGVKNGFGVVAGKAITNIAADYIPGLPKTGMAGAGVKIGVAAAVTMFLGRMAPAGMRPYLAAGAFAAGIEDMVMAIPGAPVALKSSLSAYPSMLSALPGPSVSQTDLGPFGMGAYPLGARSGASLPMD